MDEKFIFLEVARSHVFENIGRPNGMICPCCEMFCKSYRRKFNSGMARLLIWLYHEHQRGEEWSFLENARHRVRGHEPGRLAERGLVEARPNSNNPKAKCSGDWKITQRGVNFVCRRTKEVSHAVIYNNEVMVFNGEEIDIVQALGEHFDYQELMSNQ